MFDLEQFIADCRAAVNLIRDVTMKHLLIS